MPRSLHPHLQLKRSHDVDPYDHIDPDHLVEDLPPRCHDPQLQAAKRRRVEAIALQYYRARTPFILTAGLKGPFGDGWKNPWAENAQSSRAIQGPRPETLPNKTTSRVNRRARLRDNSTRAQGTNTQSLRVPVVKDAEEKSQPSQTISPEASRAAVDDLEHREHTHSLDDLEVPPATASLLKEHDMPSATEYFSASTDEYIQSRSPLFNPFWLRRPASQRRVDANQPRSSATDASPTRSRSTNAPHSLGRERYLSLPKAPLHHHRSPAEEAVPEDWRSSASASMIISSPLKPMVDHGNGTITCIAQPSVQSLEVAGVASPAQTDISSSARYRADSAQEEDDTLFHNSQSAQQAQVVIACHTPITVQSDSHTLSSQTQKAANVQTLVPATVYRTSTSIQSVGQLVDTTPASNVSAKGEQQRTSHMSSQKPSSQQPVHHDCVASLESTPPTGFMYRKVGDLKAKSNNASKSKPRAMDFSSPPALAKDARIVAKQTRHKLEAIQTTEFVEQDSSVTIDGPEVGEVDDAGETNTGEEKDRQSSHSNRNSLYSTQAAMLLAQLEFQEGTFPTVPSETPRSWTQPKNETPQLDLPRPDFAITPFSVLQAPLDKSRPPESVFRGPPISTQDLFTAVSPFAFSTAKKKNERPQQSSLRFAQLPRYDEECGAGSSPAKSPTPAVDRVPLREKNTATSFWSFVTEKPSQASQESLMKNSTRLMSDVESAQLDFAHVTG